MPDLIQPHALHMDVLGTLPDLGLSDERVHQQTPLSVLRAPSGSASLCLRAPDIPALPDKAAEHGLRKSAPLTAEVAELLRGAKQLDSVHHPVARVSAQIAEPETVDMKKPKVNGWLLFHREKRKSDTPLAGESARDRLARITQQARLEWQASRFNS